MKLNEPGRQRLGRQAQHAKLQSDLLKLYCVVLYYRLRKKEPLIALGFHHGSSVNKYHAVLLGLIWVGV